DPQRESASRKSGERGGFGFARIRSRRENAGYPLYARRCSGGVGGLRRLEPLHGGAGETPGKRASKLGMRLRGGEHPRACSARKALNLARLPVPPQAPVSRRF